MGCRGVFSNLLNTLHKERLMFLLEMSQYISLKKTTHKVAENFSTNHGQIGTWATWQYPALVLPSGGMADRHRKGVTTERIVTITQLPEIAQGNKGFIIIRGGNTDASPPHTQKSLLNCTYSETKRAMRCPFRDASLKPLYFKCLEYLNDLLCRTVRVHSLRLTFECGPIQYTNDPDIEDCRAVIVSHCEKHNDIGKSFASSERLLKYRTKGRLRNGNHKVLTEKVKTTGANTASNKHHSCFAYKYNCKR
ncbi:hypothetical protein CSKR_109695 [Clonorchis sinensis]|uniref:Uncharacterized protein n=1 Tax=Clonorchis sinensis TaxID=79923 RepID=A0A3R7EMN2_CLOSI|nr:hypothetical protein CSKR_109695 [Clonorchis sinensis]